MKTIFYLISRLLQLVIVLLVVSVVIFAISHVLPGNPAHLFVGLDSTPDRVEKISNIMGLNRPLYEQYLNWMSDLFHGDLGTSWLTGEKVLDDLKRRFPATFELTTFALAIAIVVGIPLGILSAAYKNRLLDNIVRGISLIGVSLPSFWLGLVLIYILFSELKLFPAPSGRLPIGFPPPDRITGMYIIDSAITQNWVALTASLRQMIMPVFTLVIVTMAPITRLMRSAMLEVLQNDFIRAARANGIPNRVIYFNDAARNALLSPITMLGVIYGNLLGGSVVIEKVFTWPGMGRYALDSIISKDYGPLQGFVLFSALIYVIVFLLVDIVYFIIDPRVTE
jgi:peptide/nickel transport system permease protein